MIGTRRHAPGTGPRFTVELAEDERAELRAELQALLLRGVKLPPTLHRLFYSLHAPKHSPADLRARVELARRLIEAARSALGRDLAGFSVVDLLADNMPELTRAECRQLVHHVQAAAAGVAP